MHNLSNSIVGPGPDAMLIYKFDCNLCQKRNSVCRNLNEMNNLIALSFSITKAHGKHQPVAS